MGSSAQKFPAMFEAALQAKLSSVMSRSGSGQRRRRLVLTGSSQFQQLMNSLTEKKKRLKEMIETVAPYRQDEEKQMEL